jgi:hypothetical protein
VIHIASIRPTNPEDIDPVAQAMLRLEADLQFAIGEHRRGAQRAKPDVASLELRLDGPEDADAALAERGRCTTGVGSRPVCHQIRARS